ncbi:hypothetical protein F4801DRAFT_555691 [Xylaria longipes]|nr:hypothetical protein F4801DRAFT_555691 [Xylaria longipes]RYC58361.1 hypothetical protein CHU98_g7848 [Xylaria longipes]
MSYTDPFGFCDLPTEVRINVLECTDLLTPTREVVWNPISGYRVPPRGEWMNRSWRPPGALFLVSKALYALAREVFFRHNQIVVWAHGTAFAGLPGSPADYAATTFFADTLTAGTFRHLRHLELPALPVIGPTGKKARELARSNWMRALQRVYDNGGLDNLRFLRITGSWDDAPDPDSFLSRNPNPATDLVIIRNFVKDRIWPSIDPEHGTPLLPRQLMVEMQGWRIHQSRYSIRKKGEHNYERADILSVAGLTMSRLISWVPPNQHHGQGRWVEDAQHGEWIEEAWLKVSTTNKH